MRHILAEREIPFIKKVTPQAPYALRAPLLRASDGVPSVWRAGCYVLECAGGKAVLEGVGVG